MEEFFIDGEAMRDSTIEIGIFKQVLFIAHVYMHHDYLCGDGLS